jgi:hypothetical protein
LLLQSASIIAECPELPQREGHLPFVLSPEEMSADVPDEFDARTEDVPRPSW